MLMSWMFTEKLDFQGEEVYNKPICRGNWLKTERPGQFEDLREVCKKEVVVFLRAGVDTPMHTMRY